MNIYGWSKQQFDLAVAERHVRQEKTAAALGRPQILQRLRPQRIPQGPYDERAGQGVRWCQGRRAGTPVQVAQEGIADGDQRRDFIYVDDAVRRAALALDATSVNGIFNVGTGKAESFRDMIGAMFKALGRAPNIEYIDMPENDPRPVPVFHARPISRTCAAPAIMPTSCRSMDAVAEYVTGYLDREDRYR